MDSEDDIVPLIEDVTERNRDIYLELNAQLLNVDTEFEQVVFGYKKSRWRTVLVYMFSSIFCFIPALVFHWCPTWFLYLTCVRSCFQLADRVLVIETYQKKCKNFYIHNIQEKNIDDASGLLNEGFQSEVSDEKSPVENPDVLHTPIRLDDGTSLNVVRYRYFRHKKQSFIWDGGRARWALLAGVESGATCALLHALGATAPSSEKRVRMLNIYGLNEIKVEVQSIATLVLLEVFNPFYVFQLFTIAVWLAEPYYYYCAAVVIMSTFGVATSVIQTRKNQENLRATVEAYDTVQLWDGRTVDSRCVSPGDVIVLPRHGCVLHVDAALLSGACVLNESMLTGESVPVTKTALLRTDRPFDMKEHASNVLFCGTRVIQARPHNGEPVRALVLRTGYNTSKGQLVRSILYPVPADFKFDRDSYKFIIILAFIAMVGLAYTVALKAYRALTPGDIAIKALDIITIVIPPALPAAMTVGRLYAVTRLKKARVSCLNTRAVNVSGSLDCICFDKTGTLTEDGLDMWGVVPVSAATAPVSLSRPQRDPRALNDLHELKIGMACCHSLTLLDGELAGDPLDLKALLMWGVITVWAATVPVSLSRPQRDPRALNDLHELKNGMACCHSLTLVDGELAGDPLDLKMFESTGWLLEEPDVPEQSHFEVLTPTIVKPKTSANINVDDIHMPLEVGIVLQHQFVSALQRASVVVRMRGEDVLRVYCKGAPETLRGLCEPNTVPADLNEVLSSYAERGYRVIALATRIMENTVDELQRMTRDEVERNLEFLGLVIMENRLKAASTGIIRELKEANILVVMITGDNIHTAVSVAKECGILASGERVVHLSTDLNHNAAPVVYCESTVQGSPVGGRVLLQKEWASDDSGCGSWGGSRGGGGEGGAEGGPPRYKVVMSGDTWRVLRDHYPHMVGRVIARGAVFARMTSDQKQQLVVEYQALGYYVGMCGDGANDCGALRSAHAGISLSELESSVAAPFTSAHPDIVCVSRVLREGRAALTTSFGVFKFMISYSLTEFLSVAFLYYFDSNLTDFQFLFIDVALVVNFAFFFGMTEAYTGKLCKIPPLTSLLGLVPLFSLIGQMALIILAQYASYYALTTFPWYERHTYRGDEEYECWENYAIFAVSMFQYVIQAIVFSHGSPYRKSVFTNKHLMVSFVIMTVICIYITIAPAQWLANFLQLKMPKDSLLAYIILLIAAIQFLVALFFERVIIEFMMEGKQIIPRFLKEKRIRKTPHLSIKRQLTDMDYLDYNSSVSFDKETVIASDSSSGKGS